MSQDQDEPGVAAETPSDTFVFFALGAPASPSLDGFECGDRLDGLLVASVHYTEQMPEHDTTVFASGGHVIFQFDDRRDGAFAVMDGGYDSSGSADATAENPGAAAKLSDLL